jgi:hypothetical protein
MREDLLGALNNALERGESLEKAIHTLISAGYAEADVRAAAADIQNTMLLNQEVSASMPPTPKKTFFAQLFSNSSTSPQPLLRSTETSSTNAPLLTKKQPLPAQNLIKRNTLTSFEVHTPKDNTMGWIITFTVILFLSVLALVLSILFKDQLLRFFG